MTKERIVIAFFGRRNSGKSSLVNAVTNQNMSIVSDVAGTTTDPVSKTMELLPIGPVVMIDTPGIDDVGKVGELRVKRTKEILRKADIAVLVLDVEKGVSKEEQSLVQEFQNRKIPYVVVCNKSDLWTDLEKEEREQKKIAFMNTLNAGDAECLFVSAKTKEGVFEFTNTIGSLYSKKEKCIVADLLHPGDTVILVLPIDESAPKGRLILPQQQVLRELLDYHCKIICVQVAELADVLAEQQHEPALVITDSQVFESVNKLVDEQILLTSFSILFARYKGDLPALVRGAKKLEELEDGNKILIAEGCTHHRQCNDIGSVKIPNWIRNFSKKELKFEYSSGNEFKEQMQDYAVVIHCGGCMLNEREMQFRTEFVKSQQKEMVNYGIAIAHMHGILKRAIQPFYEELERK